MIVTPDLSEVQESVEAGQYHVRVTDSETGEWNTTKGTTKYIKWTLETMNEATPGNNGRKIWYSTPITGKGAFIIAKLYSAATGEFLTKDNAGFDTEQIIGKELNVVVDINDKGYVEVKSVSKLH